MEIKSIICIDGGGTKTFGIKYEKIDNKLKIINKIEIKEQSNVLQDKDLSIQSLKKVIDKLKYSNSTYIYIGVAGFQGYPYKEEFVKELSELIGITNIEIGSDIDLLQYAFNQKGKNILLSIAGTGSAHFVSKNESTFEFGGWGNILGDEGSGYEVGLQMIKQGLKEYEDNLEPILLNQIYAFYKIKDAQELKQIVYPLEDKSIISSFASFISKQEEINNSAYVNDIYRSIILNVVSRYKDFLHSKQITVDEMFMIGGLVVKNISYQKELFYQLDKQLHITNIKLVDLDDFTNTSNNSLNPLTRIAYRKLKI